MPPAGSRRVIYPGPAGRCVAVWDTHARWRKLVEFKWLGSLRRGLASRDPASRRRRAGSLPYFGGFAGAMLGATGLSGHRVKIPGRGVSSGRALGKVDVAVCTCTVRAAFPVCPSWHRRGVGMAAAPRTSKGKGFVESNRQRRFNESRGGGLIKRGGERS